MKIALYQSQREIHTVIARAAPGDYGLKSNPKDYQQKWTYLYGHPTKYKGQCCLPQVYQAGDRSSMTITTDLVWSVGSNSSYRYNFSFCHDLSLDLLRSSLLCPRSPTVEKFFQVSWYPYGISHGKMMQLMLTSILHWGRGLIPTPGCYSAAIPLGKGLTVHYLVFCDGT